MAGSIIHLLEPVARSLANGSAGDIRTARNSDPDRALHRRSSRKFLTTLFLSTMELQTILPLGLRRLLQLAEHLEHGQLGHDEFSFNSYHKTTECGTIGCALGECPTIWPECWMLVPDSSGYYRNMLWPHLRTLGNAAAKTDQSASIFFNLTIEELSHLFYPNRQITHLYGGEDLGDDATKQQVAANIRAFVAIKAQALNVPDQCLTPQVP